MGNQEAKQRRAHGSYLSVEEGWTEGEKKVGKHGRGGGVLGTTPGKRKNKSEAKSSVFSIRKRKRHLKGKGDAISDSKDDILSSQYEDLDTKTPDISADELGQSDVEDALPDNKGKGGQLRQEMHHKSLSSPEDNGCPKALGSLGSDTEIYSFHSAAEHDDLLADIQLAIRLQHQQRQGELDPHSEGDMKLRSGERQGRRKDGKGGGKLTSPEVLDLTLELELSSEALSLLKMGNESEHMETARKHLPLPRKENTEEGEEEEESNCKREGSLCVAAGTKDQHALLQQPSHTAIAMSTMGGAAISPVTMTTSRNNPDFPGEEENGGEPEANLYPEVLESLNSGTSADSLNDCLSANSQPTSISPCCRRSSISLTSSIPQESPRSDKHLSGFTQPSSSPLVKTYPPIFPSYIKTTTRQLSSPGQSPGWSPSHSPLTPRRGHPHLHRYLMIFKLNFKMALS